MFSPGIIVQAFVLRVGYVLVLKHDFSDFQECRKVPTSRFFRLNLVGVLRNLVQIEEDLAGHSRQYLKNKTQMLTLKKCVALPLVKLTA
jgi:hypothetical protein